MQTLYEQEPTASPLLPQSLSLQQEEQTRSEEPATRANTTAKQIVSKRTYARRAMRKSLLFALGSSGGILCLVGCYYGIYELAIGVKHMPFLLKFPVLLFVTLLSGGGIYELLKQSTRLYNKDIGVPLTRANTAGLPAPDSLVRASSEPLQAQEAVLLRAAAHGQETPPEQLVRASAGTE